MHKATVQASHGAREQTGHVTTAVPVATAQNILFWASATDRHHTNEAAPNGGSGVAQVRDKVIDAEPGWWWRSRAAPPGLS